MLISNKLKTFKFKTIKKKLNKIGIDPLIGDCLAFASELQYAVDPKCKKTIIECTLVHPYGNIAHCMLRDEQMNYWDIDGKHKYDEAWRIMKSYVDDDECFNIENEEYDSETINPISESCVDQHHYNDFKVLEICSEKTRKDIRKILRQYRYFNK